MSESYLKCDWPAANNVRACVTTRLGGDSQKAFASLNLALHVGDDPVVVRKNRKKLKSDLCLNSEPFWLNQVHGIQCLAYSSNNTVPEADASWTDRKKAVCVVMTADCLPMIFSNKQGTWIAACHAGWRGLLNGVIQNTISKYPGPSADLIAWIGPAISQPYFEVGEEVKLQFEAIDSTYAHYFLENVNSRFQFDFFGVAKSILTDHSISSFGGSLCSFADEQRFFSYRRDGETGRMATLIWLE